ncbi:MAG: Flp pilus assembly complex ATPase component TadA, partial [Lachnospiraceae bacterium]|nr:Flp pilus assembly complex ATPase component TadA [Lachnospiraceae bacterium]
MDPTVKEGFGRRRRRLGDILVDAGVITEEQLLQALEYQSQQPKKIRLGLALVQKGITTEVKIMEALKEQLHIESVTLTGYEISSDIIKMVAEPSMLKKHAMIPYSINPEYPNRLYVAMADPLDIVAMDDLGVVTGMDIVPAIATNTEIMSAIDRYYGGAETRAMADRFAQQRGDKDDDAKTEEMQAEVESSPIVVLVKTIIEQAVRMRASDIHIEPLETIIRVRYRIDGVLQEINRYQVSLLSAIIARIKIIGGMDISEKRKPQDGR